MRGIKVFAAIVFFSLLAVTGRAQTADEILTKHFEALGGKDKIKSIKTLSIESDIEVMGNNAPMVLQIVDGKGLKNVVSMNGMEIVQVVTETEGWAVNPMAGASGPAPMTKEQFESSKGQIYVGGPLFDYLAKGNKVELQGKEGELFKIKVTNETPFASVFFIDPATYYISKSIISGNIQGQPVDITSTYSDYRKTDFGYVMPYTSNIDYGQFQIASNIKKVEFNKEIDPKIFVMTK